MARTVEIAVPLKALEFPLMCANCGAATSESLDVAKVFHHTSEGTDSCPDSYLVEHVMVPFCPPCMARHDSEVRKVTARERFWMICRGHEALGVPSWGVLTLLALYAFLRRPHVFFLGLASVFGLLIWYSYRTAYRDSEHLAIPPATSVTSAFDFSDVHARYKNREHRTLLLRNDLFADNLVARNPASLWTPDDDAKHQSGWQRFFR